MRTADELTAVAEPAWPQLETELLATPEITVLPIASAAGRAQHDLASTTRSPAPMTELFSLQDEFAARFAAEPDTTSLHIRVV